MTNDTKSILFGAPAAVYAAIATEALD